MGRVNKVFTDLAVIAVESKGLVLLEIYPGLTPEDLQSVTDAKLTISSSLKEIEL
jgi:acyl CoA:acetate/3-ketoacid CoA transferase beta subunit